MNVLFVCTGNTCRSIMAQGYLKSRNLSGVTVKSAGLCANGEKVSENACAAAKERNIDISRHISKQITQEDINWADKIFCLGKSHYNALLSVGADAKKLFVLGDGIADPYGSGIEVYRMALNEIITAIDSVFPKIETDKPTDSIIMQIAELEKACFSEPWSAESVKSGIENGSHIITATFGDKLAGYCIFDCVLDEGYICNIAVGEKYRRQGVADLLMCELDDFANGKNLSFVSLEVRQSNASAINLYKKHKYIIEGERKNFYKNPSENAYIMTKRKKNENFEY